MYQALKDPLLMAMNSLPGSVRAVAVAGPWGDTKPGGGAHATDGSRNYTSSLLAHFATASPARRIIAARAWGRTLARLHTTGRTATVGEARVESTGPYRFEVKVDWPGRSRDAAAELAAECDWIRTHLRARGIDPRTMLCAFLEGYRSGGATVMITA